MSGCASAPARSAPRCGGGAISDPAELARLAGCVEIAGDLVLSGAALLDLEALASVTRIRGDLTLGPTSRLANAQALGALEAIDGDLIVARNFELGGLYFGSLRQVGGQVIVERNLAMLSASLHRLASTGGGIAVRANASLERLDLSALASVGGDLDLETRDELVIALPDSVTVRGKRHIDPPN